MQHHTPIVPMRDEHCRDECLAEGNLEFAAVFQETIDRGIEPIGDEVASD